MSDPVLLTGRSGSTYTLDPAPLARGGQGQVWGARRDDGLSVAIKFADDQPVSRAALEHEATLLGLLAAGGIQEVVALLDRVDWDERPGFVMPRYPGDAEAHVARLLAGPWALEEVLAFAGELARALGALHDAEVPLENGRVGRFVHRDVKPQNVLVDERGAVRLVDLGGTLLVDEVKAARLAVFGSPLWAPYDQILPGLPEANPTWDTYALCCMVFVWFAGQRPAFQADPTPMLTERGRAIWQALLTVARAPQHDPDGVRAAHRAFQELREGTTEADLVEVRGQAAIQAEDLELLSTGIHQLGDPEIYGDDGLNLCVRDLGLLLGRGLSPLSHPSPPNRYWDAVELAQELDLVRLRLVQVREARQARLARAEPPRPAPLATAASIDPELSDEQGLDPVPEPLRPRPAPPRAGPPRWLVGVLVGLGLFAALSLPLGYKLLQWSKAKAQAPAMIDGGAFPFGDTFGEGQEDERPVRSVELTRFWMDRTEVSHQDYAACQAAGACTALAWRSPDAPADPKFIGLGGDQQPVVGVDWNQARAYCAWKGGRLPTEEEWEKAATWSWGAKAEGDKRRWPWGEAAPDCTRANSATCGRNTTLQVDSLPEGASAWGVVNLAGNVWEWTASRYPLGPTEVRTGFFKNRRELREPAPHYVLRGGAYNTPGASLRPTFRRHDAPEAVAETYGFRCVYDEG